MEARVHDQNLRIGFIDGVTAGPMVNVSPDGFARANLFLWFDWAGHLTDIELEPVRDLWPNTLAMKFTSNDYVIGYYEVATDGLYIWPRTREAATKCHLASLPMTFPKTMHGSPR